MAFYGSSFIFDGTPSELYGLRIMNIDADAVNKSMGSSNLDISETKIYRRATPYFYGSTPSPKLSFEFSAFSEGEMDAELFSLVQKWLFSSRTYKRFQIDQFDMQNVYFNAMFVDPEINRVGNIIQGFSCTVQCDSPFAYRFPQTVTYNYVSATVDDTIIYNNRSDDTGNYLYPDSLVLTVNDIGGDITITNAEDNNRIMLLEDLVAGEVVTLNCSLQTIESSTGLKRLSNFNKHWLRLVPGKNTIRIQGNISSFAMTNTWVAKKVSG